MKFTIEITAAARKGLKKVTKGDGKIGNEINATINKIRRHPETGKEMTYKLSGLRSVATADKKYRIVYKIDAGQRIVMYAIGHRNRVYDNLARALGV